MDYAISSRSIACGTEKVFSRFAPLVIVTWLAGCAGLQQFPETSEKYSEALTALDQDYANALTKMYPDDLTTADDSRAKQIRNHLIETRMAVIDEHYRKFVTGLAREDVGVEFGVSLIGIGVGGAGALVSETTSQILSAVSGGLAGAQSAYGKAVLYERAMTALIAQMEASRATIAARIYQRWDDGIASYPLWLARRDLEAYAFAGSLPGAIVATAADAEQKQEEANEILLEAITPAAVTEEAFERRANVMEAIDQLNLARAQGLVTLMVAKFPSIEPFVEAQYTPRVRRQDVDGAKARLLLKQMVAQTALTPDSLAIWEAAINEL